MPDQRQPGIGASHQLSILLLSWIYDDTVVQSEARPTVVQSKGLKQSCYLFITNNYLVEMISGIIFTNYFSEFIHKIQVAKGLSEEEISIRHYI